MESQELDECGFSGKRDFLPPPYQQFKSGMSTVTSQAGSAQVSGRLDISDPMAPSGGLSQTQFANSESETPQPSAPAVQLNEVIVATQSSATPNEDANTHGFVGPKRGQAFDLFAICRGFKEMWYYGVVALLWPSALQSRLLSPYPELRYLVKRCIIVDVALYVSIFLCAFFYGYFIFECDLTYHCHSRLSYQSHSYYDYCYYSAHCSGQNFAMYLLVHGALFAVFGALLASQTGLRVYIRWSLRSKLGLTEGTKLQDCCVTAFCTGLSLIQLSEAQREEKLLGDLKNVSNGITRV